ncbi:hypothetical protein TRVL_01811 [Trypanosoma vivax]|nr:hypothetical protein TRVL_01811 [Trypanosoma vivax]
MPKAKPKKRITTGTKGAKQQRGQRPANRTYAASHLGARGGSNASLREPKASSARHVYGDALERRGLLARRKGKHPKDELPTLEQLPWRTREEDRDDDGCVPNCRWREKQRNLFGRTKARIIQKHPEKQLSSDPKEVQDAPDSDGEAKQEEQCEKEFVCQQCRRVLKSKAWLTRHKCEPTSIINSEDSSVAEQPVTAARPICGKEYHYRRLRRRMLTEHPGHDESLRPRPRVKLKRNETRTGAQSQGEGSGSLESAGGRDVDVERPRKRSRLGRHTDDEEGEIMCVADAEVRTSSGIRWFGTRARITNTLRQ